MLSWASLAGLVKNAPAPTDMNWNGMELSALYTVGGGGGGVQAGGGHAHQDHARAL